MYDIKYNQIIIGKSPSSKCEGSTETKTGKFCRTETSAL